MTFDSSVYTMVQQSARAFGARHRAVFQAIEGGSAASFEPALVQEVADLGWLSSFSDPDTSTDLQVESQLLAALVSELGQHSPALAVALLAHHLCRIVAVPSRETNTWFGLDSNVLDRRLAPTTSLCANKTEGQLTGSLGCVLGGTYASQWLTWSQLSDTSVSLVLVECGAASVVQRVETLGLRGIGALKAAFAGVACERHRSIAVDHDATTKLGVAHQFIVPGLLGLLSALLRQTQQLAADHAQHRRQNGRLLVEIPAVAEMLASIDRALALVHASERAYREPSTDAEMLIDGVRSSTTRATDAGLQVLGGAGYVVGHGLERLWRDSRQACQLLPRRAW